MSLNVARANGAINATSDVPNDYLVSSWQFSD